MNATMEQQADVLVALLEQHGKLGNGKARELLGWDEATYEQVKEALVAKGQVAIGRWRGGSISLVANASPMATASQEAAEPLGLSATGLPTIQPLPVTYPTKRGPGRPPKANPSTPFDSAQGTLRVGRMPKASKPQANGQEAPEPKGRKAKCPKAPKPEPSKSLETWIWDAACSIRGAKDAPKYKDYILPLIFTKRLCDVFDDELDRIAAEVGSREKAFKLVKADKKLVRFYLPLQPADPEQPVWSVVRTLSDKIGEQLTTHLRDIAKANPLLQGIIDRVDFNATTHGQRDLADDRLSNLIEAISTKRLGLNDVEADIIGKSYEYLIRKFAEGGGQSAGEFYTPGEVGTIMARVLEPEPGMEMYDPTCGSAGLLIKGELAMKATMAQKGITNYPPLKLYGQEYVPDTWAMANMNMMSGCIDFNFGKEPAVRPTNAQHPKLRANQLYN